MKLFLALSLLMQSPASELSVAAADIATVAPADQQFTRYLSSIAMDQEILGVLFAPRKILRFSTNSLSLRTRFALLTEVSPTVFRLDIRDFGWTAEAWERMTLQSPYIRLGWINPADESYLRQASKSAMAIVRADHFLVLAFLEPTYSDFLQLPKTLKELEAKLGVQAKEVGALQLNVGGAKIGQSIVALHNRQLERYPTITGYFWQSRDSLTNAGDQAVLDNLGGIRFDGQEFIFSLPNKLQGYYLSNGKGEQVAVVPADIALDSITALRDKQVRNARSCVSCHAVGINPFEDVVSKLIREGKLKQTNYDKNQQLAVDAFYLTDLEKQVNADNEQFQAAVKATSGLEPEVNASLFEAIQVNFIDRPVDIKQASREIGIAPEYFAKVMKGTYSSSIAAIIAGQPVARDAWDLAYPEAVKRAYFCEVAQCYMHW